MNTKYLIGIKEKCCMTEMKTKIGINEISRLIGPIESTVHCSRDYVKA